MEEGNSVVKLLKNRFLRRGGGAKILYGLFFFFSFFLSFRIFFFFFVSNARHFHQSLFIYLFKCAGFGLRHLPNRQHLLPNFKFVFSQNGVFWNWWQN